MRDLGAVLDHEQPLLHPACDQAQQNMRDEDLEASPVLRFIVAGCVGARLVRRQPVTRVGVHRIARNNHRVRTTALRAVERAVFETRRPSLGFRMTHAGFVAPWAAGPLDIGKVG